MAKGSRRVQAQAPLPTPLVCPPAPNTHRVAGPCRVGLCAEAQFCPSINPADLCSWLEWRTLWEGTFSPVGRAMEGPLSTQPSPSVWTCPAALAPPEPGPVVSAWAVHCSASMQAPQTTPPHQRVCGYWGDGLTSCPEGAAQATGQVLSGVWAPLNETWLRVQEAVNYLGPPHGRSLIHWTGPTGGRGWLG